LDSSSILIFHTSISQNKTKKHFLNIKRKSFFIVLYHTLPYSTILYHTLSSCHFCRCICDSLSVQNLMKYDEISWNLMKSMSIHFNHHHLHLRQKAQIS
jgi:hypothetical protein